MCISCVMGAQLPRLANSDTHHRGALEDWSADDAGKAETVYRQLPRWSRQLFDLLSSAAGSKVPRTDVQASLAAIGDGAFGVDDACDWAAQFCAASGRSLPVRKDTQATGETAYWIEQPAAGLFQNAAAHFLTR